LSPSTRADDLGSKRIAYHDVGVPSYWVVDHAARTLTVFTGDYEDPVTHGPGGTVEVTTPFAVAIDLDHLLDP
jgi:Uma2 family endonuclease